jgi:hypothetical protein
LGEEPGEVDLTISAARAAVPTDMPRGTLLAEFPAGATAWKMYWLVSDDDNRGFVLRLPGHTDFEISRDLKTVICRRADDVPLAEITEFLSGNGMALLLSLAGAAVFHASAVSLPNPADPGASQAVAVFGGTGAGKSTLAALLVAGGARFLTDDVLRVSTEGEPASVVGGCIELRLRRDVAAIVGLLPKVPVRQTPDQRLAIALGDGHLGRVPLGLLVFPKVEDELRDISLTPMSPREAALALAGAPRMTGWSMPRVLETQFDCLARVATTVPAVRAAVPRTYTQGQVVPALVEQVRAHLWDR